MANNQKQSVSKREAIDRLCKAYYGKPADEIPERDLLVFTVNFTKAKDEAISQTNLESLEKLASAIKMNNGVKVPWRKGYYFQYSTDASKDNFPDKGIIIWLKSGIGEKVGLLRFRIGLPIEIGQIHGSGGVEQEWFYNDGARKFPERKNLPKELFEKTGEHYFNALIDELVKITAKNFNHIRQRGQPAKKK